MSINIILIGAPGSGKGTQAKMLIEEFGCVHLATGDILREAIKNQSEVGLLAETYIAQGKLVPDKVIIDLMRDKISQIPRKQGFILDGFPRTLAQADSLELMLSALEIEVDRVIYLEVGLKKIVTRMSGRLTCLKCGRSYHKIFNQPRMDMQCDEDQAELTVRDDDKEHVVIDRFKTFETQTQPLIDYYRAKNLLSIVDAEQDIQFIYNTIRDTFNNK